MLVEKGWAVEVLNAGVPGWVSTENLLNLQLKVLPLEPDIVVVYQGRNELFPQCYNNFVPDYSHYRGADHSIKWVNYPYKLAFRISCLLMSLTAENVLTLGWSAREDNPPYGCIRDENRPDSSEIIENLQDPARSVTQDFRFSCSDGTSLHPHPAKRNHFSTR